MNRRVAPFGLLLLALIAGCRPSIEGAVDLDAARQQSIAAGKGDPIPDPPMTPETQKERGEKLQKEARERAQANAAKAPRKGGRPAPPSARPPGSN